MEITINLMEFERRLEEFVTIRKVTLLSVKYFQSATRLGRECTAEMKRH
jgi:hypothetical protein